jgi:hypothetical protein
MKHSLAGAAAAYHYFLLFACALSRDSLPSCVLGKYSSRKRQGRDAFETHGLATSLLLQLFASSLILCASFYSEFTLSVYGALRVNFCVRREAISATAHFAFFRITTTQQFAKMSVRFFPVRINSVDFIIMGPNPLHNI